MLRLVTSSVLSCCLLGALPGAAQSIGGPPDPREGRILSLEKMWNQAQLARDSVALEHLIGASFVNTEYDGQVSDREKFLSDIRDPKYKPDVMGIQDVKINLYGSTAVVTGLYHTKGTSSGKPYEHYGRFTDTWILDDDKWQCVASHTSLVKK